MHDVVYRVVVLWQLALASVLTVYAVVTRRAIHRAMSLEALSVVVVVVLIALAIRQRSPDYLDVAVAMALLGFVQAVAVARLVSKRKDLHE